MAKPSRTFRLDSLLNRKLEEAARIAGMKVSNFVEQAVAEKLDEAGRTSREIAKLSDELRSLRRDVALSIEALLVVIGSDEKLGPEEAAQWVEQNLGGLD